MQQTIGTQLRAARITHDLSVAQLAEAVRLRPRVIEWLEADDFTPCGPPAYVRGYLRCVSSYLELPGDDLVAEYSMAYEPQPATVVAAEPVRRSRRRTWMPMAWFIVIITIVGALGYTLLAHDSHARQTMPTTSGIRAFTSAQAGRVQLVCATKIEVAGNTTETGVTLRL